MKGYTSDFIFTLSEKYKISIDPSSPSEFSDEQYYGFCNEYITLCEDRDRTLKQHLVNNPNLFRTFLPWREYVFDTVIQTQWYYDELIIYDPVYFEIQDFRTGDIESDKHSLKFILYNLNVLRDSILQGFLLFGSYDKFSNSSSIDSQRFSEILSQKEVREECDKLVGVYKMISPHGEEKSYYQIRSIYRRNEILFPVISDVEKLKTQDGYEVFYDFGSSDYKRLCVQETIEGGFYDRIYDVFKNNYHIEILEILNYIEVGGSLNTPILFDRKLDELILSNINSEIDFQKSKAIDYHKLFLPFINGIPPQRLMEVRNKMPAAFKDFRSMLFEAIYDYEKQGLETDILNIKLQNKINPAIRKLDAEMKNALTKAKIIGRGFPLISGIGALGLYHLGYDIATFSSVLFGGITATGLTAAGNFIADKRLSKVNSVYYLWKVQQV